jgi:hypothetical protein
MVNRTEIFEHEGREYEVRAIEADDGWKVRTFLDGKPVSPTYSITFETAVDIVHSGWGDAIDNLIEAAKSDITSGRLDELAEALAAK